jgi:hypothetical protein
LKTVFKNVCNDLAAGGPAEVFIVHLENHRAQQKSEPSSKPCKTSSGGGFTNDFQFKMVRPPSNKSKTVDKPVNFACF